MAYKIAKYIAAATLLIVYFAEPVSAQREASLWFFGDYAAVDFNFDPPQAVYYGRLKTEEGSSSICNQFGELQFYTDGVKVWNRFHRQTPNGDSLEGGASSTQSALIIPRPGSDSLFYIFTVDESEDLGEDPKGLSYSVFDLRLDSARGDVAEKNIPLLKPATEKLCAVKHKRKNQYWVVAHEWNTNGFRAYLVDESGLHETPVRSEAGITHGDDVNNVAGYMKFSPQGDQLACCVYNTSYAQLFDFDHETGKITLAETYNIYNHRDLYGLEFSPSGRFLYVSKLKKYTPYSTIYKLDLSLVDRTAVEANIDTIAELFVSEGFGALQLAPDGAIYATHPERPFLSRIVDPDSLGDKCAFEADAIELKSRKSFWGLPNFPADYFDEVLRLRSNSPICEGETLIIESKIFDDAQYSWSGPGGFVSTEPNLTFPGATPSVSGEYFLEVELANGKIISDAIRVLVRAAPDARVNFGREIYICQGDSVALEPANFDSGNVYVWNDADTTISVFAKKRGVYYLKAISPQGCEAVDSIEVKWRPLPTVKITSSESAVCNGVPVTLRAGGNFVDCRWSTGDVGETVVVDRPGNYFAFVENEFGCRASASFKVEEFSGGASFRDPDFRFETCAGGSEERYFAIVNTGKHEYTIEKIELISGESYKIIENILPPVDLPPGDSVRVKIRFAPSARTVYRDSLRILQSKPCDAYYRLPLEGEGVCKARVYFPADTILPASLSEVAIPLALEQICGVDESEVNFACRAKISFNMRGFYFNAIAGANVVGDSPGSERRTLEIVNSAGVLSGGSATIAEILGLVTIGDTTVLDFNIDEFEFLDKNCRIEIQNGRLRPRACAIGSSLWRYVPDVDAQILENPARGSLKFRVDSKPPGSLAVKLFDSRGAETVSRIFDSPKAGETLEIDLSALPSGYYRVLFVGGFSVSSAPLILLK